MQVLLTSDSTNAGTVLALLEFAPTDASSLMHTLRELSTQSASAREVARGAANGNELRFVARVALKDAGCHLGEDDTGTSVIYCDLTPSTWDEVTSLLEPFSRRQATHAHQYLSEHGPITWIASTDSTW